MVLQALLLIIMYSYNNVYEYNQCTVIIIITMYLCYMYQSRLCITRINNYCVLLQATVIQAYTNVSDNNNS